MNIKTIDYISMKLDPYENIASFIIYTDKIAWINFDSKIWYNRNSRGFSYNGYMYKKIYMRKNKHYNY